MVIVGCWAAAGATAQHPIFGVYYPRIVDNISPEINGELTIRPDSRSVRKAWIFNFVPNGPVLATLDVDNPDGNRIYIIPSQAVDGRVYPVGSLIYNVERQSIILSIGSGETELSFMGEKMGGRQVTAVSTPVYIPSERPNEGDKQQPGEQTETKQLPPADTGKTTTGTWNGNVPKPGEALRLKNVYFNLSEAILLPESYPELDRLAQFMDAQPSLKIRLEGHTDVIGESGKNMTLSLERVQAVKQYMVNKGVDPTRIHTKGYGDTRPLITKGTTEDRKINRRVEFVILPN